MNKGELCKSNQLIVLAYTLYQASNLNKFNRMHFVVVYQYHKNDYFSFQCEKMFLSTTVSGIINANDTCLVLSGDKIICQNETYK